MEKKNKKDKLLLVDGCNLLHRSFHKFANLKASDGKPSGAIFGFFKSLNFLIYRFRPTHVVLTFDNGKSTIRTDLNPNYKGHRAKLGIDYESLQSQKKVILKILKYLGIPYIFDKKKENNYEGDDYVAYVKHKFKGKVIIISSDKDFCQLICSRVKIYNPSKDVLINEKNCKEIMGYSALECVDYISLVGDTSDDIKGYPGIGPVKARQFLDEWKGIHFFLLHSNNTFKGIDNDKLREVYNINRTLIDLTFFIKNNPLKKLPIVYGKNKPHKLKEIFIEYSLSSFRSKEFLETFKNIQVWKDE